MHNGRQAPRSTAAPAVDAVALLRSEPRRRRYPSIIWSATALTLVALAGVSLGWLWPRQVAPSVILPNSVAGYSQLAPGPTQRAEALQHDEDARVGRYGSDGSAALTVTVSHEPALDSTGRVHCERRPTVQTWCQRSTAELTVKVQAAEAGKNLTEEQLAKAVNEVWDAQN